MKKRITALILSCALLFTVFVLPSSAMEFGGFTYETENGCAVITGYNGGGTAVTVPAFLNGSAVRKIGNGAFKNNTSLKSVTLSGGIEDVGDSAFENCTSLSSISFPETVNHIGAKAVYNTAFYNNDANWKKPRDPSQGGGGIEIGGGGSGSDTIEWEDIIASQLTYLYLGKNLIELSCVGDYNVKIGTLVIADNACKGCEGIKRVVFPKSVKTIGNNAFNGCASLNKIVLPDKAMCIGENAFYNTGMYNNGENWYENAFYIGTHLVKSQSKFETSVKEGTFYIDGCALGNRDAVIPRCVKEISDCAFADKSAVRIFGYADTYAQQYAKEHSIKFIDMGAMSRGDINFDGVANTADYAALCRIASAEEHLSYPMELNGDLNFDGAVDAFDAITLDLMLDGKGPSTLSGDVDGDGVVTSEDYQLIVDIACGNRVITDTFMRKRCDINGDGAVDAFDAIALDFMIN